MARPLGEILALVVRWRWQHIITFSVLSGTMKRHLLLKEQADPPRWFLEIPQPGWYWRNHLVDEKPDPALVTVCVWGIEKHFQRWVEEKSVAFTEAARGTIYTLLGSLPWWASTFSGWITNIWDLLPDSVRAAVSNWSGVWLDIQAKAKAWFLGTYQWLIDKANAAKTWVDGYGSILLEWWRGVRLWLRNFKDDPYGTITGYLGTNWDNLLVFLSWPLVFVFGDSAFKVTWLVNAYEELSDFYNNVWVPFKSDLFEFLDHPLLWLYDQAEDFLCGMW